MVSLSTKSIFAEPTDYLRKKGVIQVEQFTKVMLGFEFESLSSYVRNMKVCTRNVVTYYYKDHKDIANTSSMCATIPRELFNEFKEMINKVI